MKLQMLGNLEVHGQQGVVEQWKAYHGHSLSLVSEPLTPWPYATG